MRQEIEGQSDVSSGHLATNIWQISVVFIGSYISLIGIILVTDSRFIALIFFNDFLLIATSVIGVVFAKKLFSGNVQNFVMLALLYSGAATFFWWLLLLYIFGPMAGNDIFVSIVNSFPWIYYSFLSILVCCSLIYVFCRTDVITSGDKFNKRQLAIIGLLALLSVSFAILLLLVTSIIIP